MFTTLLLITYRKNVEIHPSFRNFWGSLLLSKTLGDTYKQFFMDMLLKK